MAEGNRLYYGDNLEVLRQHIATESVDLIYLDPPFNSNRSYNVLFKAHSGEESQAQIEAFDDSWHWSQQAEAQYAAIVAGGAPIKVAEAIEAMHGLLGPNDVLAYLVMMTARLVELHRVLKPTGSMYLHCDPTASHYLKVVLDAIFGPTNFRNEIIWKRTGAHGGADRYGPVHDTLLFFTKSNDFTWNQPYGAYDPTYLARFSKTDDHGRLFQDIALTGPGVRAGESGAAWREYDPTAAGRHWAIPSFLVEQGVIPATGGTIERLDALNDAGRVYFTRGKVPRLRYYVEDAPGMPQMDIWVDLPPVNSQAAERLGYPTQKPIALLERIIVASSSEGDMVLDPFCGCGTTVDAAQSLRRKWIGIDITYLAVDLIRKRLRHSYGPGIESTYEVHGIPTDVQGAEALFNENPFDFERWAVSLVDGQPNEKQVGDKGIDGRIRFHADKDAIGTIVVSVKGGKQVAPTMMRDLVGTVQQQKADMGLLILLAKPTKGMAEIADHSGTYTVPMTGRAFPKIQIATVGELLSGKGPQLPAAILPYVQASPKPGSEAVPLF
jgi:DNA modification methylase